uniref:PARG catalytic Macro domain-containing protein n=1 Tax=Mycena chlorophos TaxID=658473 RepID=A0ABQ0M7A3_MYCCL|nr:predicted protein [Mycena chlorophos]
MIMIPDLLPGTVDRELRKAYTAFASSPLALAYEVIITGHWGCGAFGGNKHVKAAIQWCAASLAGVGKPRFICWEELEGDSFPVAFRNFMDVIRADGRQGPEDVLGILRALGPEDVEEGGDGVFREILKRLR